MTAAERRVRGGNYGHGAEPVLHFGGLPPALTSI